MDLLDGFLSERFLLRNAIASAILIAAVLLVRTAALRWVRRVNWSSEEIRLRWTVQVRWISLMLLGLGLVIIWASELRSLALSVVALGVAVVLATKELILCLSGSVLRATSGGFGLNDRVEISGHHGVVIDMGPLTTTLLEIGPGHRRTGRAVVIPNSLFLSEVVRSETFTDDFVLHMITVPIRPEEDWQAAEKRLLAAADAACAPFLDEARRYMSDSARRHGVAPFVVEPSVNVQLPEPDRIDLVIRVPTRAREKNQTEQQILRRYLES